MKKLIVDTCTVYTVLALVDEIFNKVTVSKQKFVDLPHSAILEKIERLRHKYKISKIYVDKSGFSKGMYDFLRKEIGYNIVIPITFERWRD